MNIDLEKIRKLDGCNVLVKPTRAGDPNSVGLRGTVRVRDLPGTEAKQQVEIVLAYPERSDMNGLAAHEEVIPLSQTDVARLLACELGDSGTYEFTLPESGRAVK
ncbi:MAG: hypothetical protein ABW223_11970 [Rariglobus sp.]